MSKRKGSSESPDAPRRGRPPRKGKPLNIRLIPGLKDALDRYVETLRPRIGITAYVEDLIERDLIAKGFWTPSGQAPPEPPGQPPRSNGTH